MNVWKRLKKIYPNYLILEIKGLQSAIDFFEEWLLDNDDEEDEEEG